MSHKVHIIFLFLAVTFLGCNPNKTIVNSSKTKIQSKSENSLISLLIQATTEKIIGNLAEADSLFKKCIAIAPKNAVSHYEISGIRLQNDELEEALDFALKAVKYQPENEWYKLNLALIYTSNKQEKEAAKIFEELVVQHPGRYEYLYSLSDSYINIGEYKKAISPLNKLEKLIGADPELLVQKHRLYLQIGDQEKAVLEIKKLISAHPNKVRYYGLLAELYESLGREKEALEQYEKITDIDPKNGIVNISLYQFYIVRGQKEKALGYLPSAFKSSEVQLETKIDVLLQLYSDFHKSDTLKDFIFDLCQILTEIHPNNSKGFSIYADYLLQDSKPNQALKYFKKAAEHDQQTFALWNQIIILENSLNLLKELEIDSKKAMEIFPSSPTFYYFNGYSNYRLGNYVEATSTLNIGRAFVIEDHYLLAEFYQLLGDSYHELNDHENSDLNFELSLEHHPNNPYVLNNYSYYLALRETKLEKAKKMIQRAVELAADNPSYLDTYGWILFLQGDYINAEFWLLKAIDFGGAENGTILEHYGDVMFKLDKKLEALKFWKMAKENNNNSAILNDKINTGTYIE